MSESANAQTPAPPESGEYILVNAYEDMIRTKVWEMMLKDPDVCRCEKCFLDICALVINNGRHNYTKFVTTKSGSVLAKIPEMNYGRQTEMTVAVLEGIKRVKESPMH